MVYKVFKRISDLLDSVISGIAVIVFVGYTLMVFIGVLSRFVFKIPIVAGVELARVGFVWGALLGAAVAYKRGLHICFTIVLSIIPKKAGQILSLLVNIATLGFLIWMLNKSTFFTVQVSASVLSATGMSTAIIYFPLILSVTGMIFHCIVFIIQDLEAVFNKNGLVENRAAL